jgi:acylphosphatase
MSESARPAMEQREIHYDGRVQGVGFRYRAREIAVGYPIRGFVQNLFDGQVLLVVEGEASELDRFLAKLELEMRRNIEGRQVRVRPASGEFDGFEIRH